MGKYAVTLLVSILLTSTAHGRVPPTSGSMNPDGTFNMPSVTTVDISADAVVAAGKDAQEKAKAAIEGANAKDTKLSGAAARSAKVEIYGGAVSGAQNMDRQHQSLNQTQSTVVGEKAKCTTFALQALVNARAKAEKAKAAAAACNAAPSEPGKEKDCSAEDKAAAEAEQQVAAIETSLQKDCVEPLDKLIAMLGLTAKDVADASKKAKTVAGLSAANTMASGGGGGSSTKPGEVVVNCNQDDEKQRGWQNPACDAHFLKTCKPESEDDKCEMFATRYCGLEFAPAYSRPNGTTEYCKKAQPNYFCKLDPANANCLTCKDLASILGGMPVYHPIDELAENYKTCENDPIYLDPTILSAVKNHNPKPSTSYSTQTIPPNR